MQDFKQAKKIAKALDSQFEGPFGLRFGWDAIIGFIPGIGDIFTSGFSFYIIYAAFRMGVDSATLLRMAMNLMIDNFFDMIPFLGNLFDFYWKANDKNIRLWEQNLARPAKEATKSRIILALLLFMLIFLFALSVYGSFVLIKYVYQLVAGRVGL